MNGISKIPAHAVQPIKKPRTVAQKKTSSPIPGLPSGVKEKIAEDFAAVLRRWLTKAQWHSMRHENAELRAKGDMTCCASGDYCDSNMAMDEAMRKNGIQVFVDGIVPESICTLWNEVWDIAKEKYLTEGK